MVVSEIDTIELWRNSDLIWTRDESLSYATDLQILSPTVSIPATRVYLQQGDDALWRYIYRTIRHIREARHLLSYLLHYMSQYFRIGDDPSVVKHAENFGFNKCLFHITSKDRIIATGALSLETIWSKSLPFSHKILLSYKSFTNAKSYIALVASNFEPSSVKLFILDALSGEIIEQANIEGSYHGSFVSGLEQDLSQYITVITDFRTFTFPPGSPSIFPLTYWIQQNQSIIGYSISDFASRSCEIWRFRQPIWETFFRVSAIDSESPIASFGHVMANRTVWYKYININLIAVASREIPSVSSGASRVSIYLLDASSGSLIQRIHIQSVTNRAPFLMELVDNLLYYGYWSKSESKMGYTLSYVELFESAQTNTRALGSTLTPQDVYLEGRSSFTEGPLKVMAVTKTLSGITLKDVIIADASHQIISIPRQLLDVKRPIISRNSKVPKGSLPYETILNDDKRNVLSHMREVISSSSQFVLMNNRCLELNI